MILRIFLFLFFITAALAMGEEFKSDSVETSPLLFQSSSKGKKLQYEQGYWLNSILHPREFYEEIPFIPLEIRYGAGFYGSGSGLTEMKSGWIEYENNAVEEFDGGSINTRIGHQLELDILKTNLSYFLFKTSWADIHTGLNLRYSSLFSPGAIPDTSWGDVKSSWDTGSRSFSPQLFEFGLSNSVNLQWYDSWLINLRYVYGLASGKFYRTGNLYDDTPSGWGPSSAFSAGFRYVLSQDIENQFLLGVDFRYSSTEINRISDPNDVTPISKFNLSNYGVLFSLTVFKSGKPTIGSLGKEYYYHRDYVSAKEHLEEFVIQYARHSNLHRAEKYIEECRRKIPHQLVKEGMSFDERKLTEKALAKYREARNLTTDENLIKSLDDRISQIAQKNMRNAENMMSHGESDSALEIIVKTAVYSKEAQESIPRFRGRAYLNEGEKAKDAGFYLKALEFFEKALAQDRDLKIEVNYLRHEIATLLVHQANRAEDLSAIQLVIQSLEDAKDITGDLGEENENILKVLKEKIVQAEEIRSQADIDRRMEIERERRAKWSRPTLQIGMTIPQVQEILGEPTEIVHKTNQKGEDMQLWLYGSGADNVLQLSFLEFILFKIERG